MLHTHVFLVAPLGTCDMAQAGADEHQSGIAVGGDTHHPDASSNLPAQVLNDVVGADLHPVFEREIVVCQCLFIGLHCEYTTAREYQNRPN